MGEMLESELLNPQVTVLMAVYDPQLQMLAQALDSIQRQTFSNFELLIIDDGSRDPDVLRLLRQRAERDARIRIAQEPHRGLTPALNRGLALARGTWIARQDADDWSEPPRLQSQVEYFRTYPQTTVLGTIAWTHQQNGRPLWPMRLPTNHDDILHWLPHGNPFVHGSVMFPRLAAASIGGYREEFRCSQDYDFLWRLAERGFAANLAEPLYHYRYTNSSVSALRTSEQVRTRWAIQRLAEARQRGELQDIAEVLAQAEDAVPLESSFKQADHLMLAGKYREAFAAYLKLLGSQPRSPRAWAKLARLGVFTTIPPLRQACFR